MINNTGNYFEHESESSQQPIYYTFTPKPLVGNSFYSIDEELSSLLIEAHTALGVLEGMDLYMPDREILQNIFLYRECCYSRLIDYPGSKLPFQEDNTWHIPNADPVKNIIFAHKNMAAQEPSIKTLEHVCSMAKYGSDSNEKMLIRKTPMFLTNAITNVRKYSPTAPEHILQALKDIFVYLKNDPDALIKAAMSHYQFEMIHPFDCYNGIVGRMLIRQVLLNSGCGAVKYMSPSEALYEAKNDYFDMLSSTQMSGGYIRWIKFFTAIILESAQRSRNQIEKYHQVIKRDEEKLQKSEPASIKNTLAILEYWKCSLVSGITQSAKDLGLSLPLSLRIKNIRIQKWS